MVSIKGNVPQHRIKFNDDNIELYQSCTIEIYDLRFTILVVLDFIDPDFIYRTLDISAIVKKGVSCIGAGSSSTWAIGLVPSCNISKFTPWGLPPNFGFTFLVKKSKLFTEIKKN